MLLLAFALALAAEPSAGAAAREPGTYLYRASFVQAAPGRLLELIELEKELIASAAESGDEPPLWMRHSQGDKWDLLLLAPMASWPAFYDPARAGKRERWRHARGAILAKAGDAIAWQEDLFVLGPPLAELREHVRGSGFFHVEIFVALPGRQADLYRAREMENAYGKELGRPRNLIFVRDQGAAWDLFTIGCYRDLKHYAESADIPESAQEAAARAAGFPGAKGIGPYLRTLIREHHDTLATAIK
jgi:hypothetical protein